MTTLDAPPAELAGPAAELMAAHHVPGMAVGLLQDGRMRAWGFGVANVETGAPVTPGTLFQFGSISKVVTATLIMQMVGEGRLELDAPARRYLPDLRLQDDEATAGVTLRHLLTHTSGIYGDRFEDYGQGDDALARAVGEFGTLRQWTAPGECWAYCNTGFQLAGRVAEAVLGTPFEQAARERVLLPAGMDRAFYFAHEAITYPVAVGHNKLPERAIEIARSWGRARARAPQGGLTGTVSDLLRFAALHLRGGITAGGIRLLDPALARIMQTPQVEASSSADAYGLAWQLRRARAGWIVGHGGSTNGFRAALALSPEHGVAVAVLTNGSEGFHVTKQIEQWALDRFAGGGRVLPPVMPAPAAALRRFEGRYHRPGNVIDVSAGDDALAIHLVKEDPFTRVLTEWPVMRALPLGGTHFLGADGLIAEETLDFLTAADGTVRYLRLDGRLHEPAPPED